MICQKHLKQQESLEGLRANVKRHLLAETAYSAAIIERNLRINGNCILWVGLQNNKGYGKAWYPKTGKLILLHRLIWAAVNGAIPDKKNILHSCDTPGCINPEHLSAGTQSENIKDAFRRGRMDMSGDKHPQKIVTGEQVIEMRKLYAEGVMQKDLAKRFGLKCNSVSYIVNRRNWTKI